MRPPILTKRRVLVISLLAAGASAAYVALLLFPDPLFAYKFRHGHLLIHSDEPIPPSAAAVLDQALSRLEESPLDRPSAERRIYVCNRAWRFCFFANFRYNAGGLAYALMTNNIFLRGSRFDRNTLIGPSGNEVPGERTLSYFIAHELAHTLIADRLGFFGYWRLPVWKDEGYSDYLAKGPDFRMADAVEMLRRDDPKMDPIRSGLYLRYHVLVAHLLVDKGMSVPEFLAQDFDMRDLERELTSPPAASP